MRSDKNHFDIILVGTGLVGLSFVLALRDAGLKTLVLEKNLPRPLSEIKNDQSRPISLSYGSAKHFKQWSIWKNIEAFASPILTVQVSQRGKLGTTTFSAENEKIPALGYAVPFDTLKNELAKAVVDSPYVSWIETDQFKIISHDEQHVSLMLTEKDECYSAQLLIIAAGNNTALCNQLNISRKETDHQEIAITGKVFFEKEHRHTAYERFCAPGTLAILPLQNKNECTLVWAVERSSAIAALSDTAFTAAIQDAFGYRLGKILHFEKNARYPLQTSIASTATQPGIVLLGNSAHTIYPIAAQGFNLSLRDVIELAQKLKMAAAERKPLGSLTVLKSYEKNREPDQRKVMGFVQKTDDIFSLTFPGAGTLRSLALIGLDFLPAVKKRWTKRFLGITRQPPTK